MGLGKSQANLIKNFVTVLVAVSPGLTTKAVLSLASLSLRPYFVARVLSVCQTREELQWERREPNGILVIDKWATEEFALGEDPGWACSSPLGAGFLLGSQ